MAAVAGLFNNASEAERAVDLLKEAGVGTGSIALVSKSSAGATTGVDAPTGLGLNSTAAPIHRGSPSESLLRLLLQRGVPRRSASLFLEAILRGDVAVVVKPRSFKRREAREVLQHAHGITAKSLHQSSSLGHR